MISLNHQMVTLEVVDGMGCDMLEAAPPLPSRDDSSEIPGVKCVPMQGGA